MVVDKAHDSGLEVSRTLKADEERAFDIDVPDLIGPRTLVVGVPTNRPTPGRRPPSGRREGRLRP